MRRLLLTFLLAQGLAFGQLDLSTPGGRSVLATFVTDPPGAQVYVAQTFIGRGPATVRINADTPTPYTVRVPGGEFEVYSGTVTLSQTGVTEVYVPRRAPVPTPSGPVPPTATGTANTDLLLGMAACAELSDNLARLTCYDRLADEYGSSGDALPSPSASTALGSELGSLQGSGTASPRDAPLRTPGAAVPAPVPRARAVTPGPAAPRPSLFDLARDGSYEEVYEAVLAGEAVAAADAYGQTVLMYAARGNEDPNVHTTLVASGAEVNARSLADWSALMYAARDNPNPDVVLRLLELGADPHLINDEGQTALDLGEGNPALRGTYALDRLATLTTVTPPPIAAPQASPSSAPPAPVSSSCCKYCRKGYACGNSCIARNKTCRVGPGCACNADVGTDDRLIAAEEHFFVGLEADYEEVLLAGVCGEAVQLGAFLP